MQIAGIRAKRKLSTICFQILQGGTANDSNKYLQQTGANGTVYAVFGSKIEVLEGISIETLITNETQRLSDKFGKAFLDCEDIAQITGLGRDNSRALMKSKQFPIVTVGRRQVVSILSFVTWQMKNYL